MVGDFPESTTTRQQGDNRAPQLQETAWDKESEPGMLQKSLERQQLKKSSEEGNVQNPENLPLGGELMPKHVFHSKSRKAGDSPHPVSKSACTRPLPSARRPQLKSASSGSHPLSSLHLL